MSIEEYPLPGAGPYAVTLGPGRALGVTLVHSGAIGRVDP